MDLNKLLSISEKYDKYGNPVDKIIDDIKSGDLVQYLDSKSHFEGKKKINVRIPLQGIWDGEKVQFNDKEQTVVRTIHWLTKINPDV